MATQMQQRRGTAAEWAAINPTLAAGEIGVETDTGVMQIGNGTTPWNALGSPFLQRAGGVMQAPSKDLVPLTLKGNADQAADLFRVVDINGNILAGIRKNGQYYVTGSDFVSEKQATAKAKGDLLVALSDTVLARLPVGPNGYALTADSSVASGMGWSPVSKASEIEVFTASGTWTKKVNAKIIVVIAIGGGQSGEAGGPPGNSPYANSSGGAGGSRVQVALPANALPQTVPITIGSGGIGPKNVQYGGASVGGDTTFGDYVTAPGGGKAGSYIVSGVGLLWTVPVYQQARGGSGNGLADVVPPLNPGGGTGYSNGYGQTSASDGGSPFKTVGVSRSGSGAGGDGGRGSKTSGQNGFIPGGGGGGAATDTYLNLVSGGDGGRGEIIIITQY